MALASTFISTTAAFLECTKEEKCSKQKKYALSGEDKDSDNGESIVGAADVFAGFNRGETDTDTLTMDSFTEFTKPNIL